MITIKSEAEINIMSEGGKRLAAIIEAVAKAVRPGITTGELEKLARRLIKQSGGQSSFLGFHDYPAVTCISVNEVVVHGIPGARKLEDGDIVGIDIGLMYQGFCTDSAVTVAVGTIAPDRKKLLEVTKQSLMAGLKAIMPHAHIGDISHAIEQSILPYGYGIVRDLTGHGIGRSPHEEPSVPNLGNSGTGPILKEGMTLAIEPMVTLGNPQIMQLPDGWTIATIDGSPAAHFEHTVVVTSKGYRILTLDQQ